MKEQISVFDIFKIGIGPSSSHTLGPWKAAQSFSTFLLDNFYLAKCNEVKILLYGSLAKTGKGHGTDIAVIMGLTGHCPERYDTNNLDKEIASINYRSEINLANIQTVRFNPSEDIIYLTDSTLPFHPNGITFQAFLNDGKAVSQTYFSIGGGFIVLEGEKKAEKELEELPFPIENAGDLEKWCEITGSNISDIVLKNEEFWRQENEIQEKLALIIKLMKGCIFKGSHTLGELSGGLHVKRRAGEINANLINNKLYCNFEEWLCAIRETTQHFNNILAWVSCFALAVNEENAAFGRIITAPTNGSAGVIPAVMMYFMVQHPDFTETQIQKFLLTASEIGSIFKKGATISAAMGGCQAEIGVSSAMAAAGLTELMGGSAQQVLMAAEIAMEHHLGLTCDPVGGLVQVPCIERNAMGAIKAITASQLALHSDPQNAKVSLDMVVNTMWQTAVDMNLKYKETSEGGLAIQLPVTLPEC